MLAGLAKEHAVELGAVICPDPVVLCVKLRFQNDAKLLDLPEKYGRFEATATCARLGPTAAASETLWPGATLRRGLKDLAQAFKQGQSFLEVDSVLGTCADREHSLKDVGVRISLDASRIVHLPIICAEFTVVGHNRVLLPSTDWHDLNRVENGSQSAHHCSSLAEKSIRDDPSSLLLDLRLYLVVFDQLLVCDHEPLQPVHQTLKRISAVTLLAILAVKIVFLRQVLDDCLLYDIDARGVLLTVAPIV